jgi:hypothetical protein
MKINKKSFLRILTILSFLIFTLPFFQMCESKKVAAVEQVTPPPPPKNTIQKVELQKPIEKGDVAVDKSDDRATVIDDKTTVNAYELAFLIKDIKFEKVKDLSVFKESTFFLCNLCYVFIILVSVFMVFWAFKNKHKKVFYGGIINIILLFIALTIWFYSDFKVFFVAIKYGQYIFLLNSLLICLFSYQSSKSAS